MPGKTCTKCQTHRPFSEFPVRKSMRDGYDSNCRPCYAAKSRAYAAANPGKAKAKAREAAKLRRQRDPEKANARIREWKANNPERAKAIRDKWRDSNWEKARGIEKASYLANRDARLTTKREWQQENKHRYAAYATKRRAAKLQATPKFSDAEAILAIYAECQRRQAETGVEHHVDHIVPLIGKKVCGLHVSWNLRVITGGMNRSKSNKLEEQDE